MRVAGVDVCGQPFRAVAAESFIESLLGVHGVTPDVEAIVIPGSSVHGLTLRTPIWVFGTDGSRTGTEGRLLRPGRVIRFPGATHVVELLEGSACEIAHRSHSIRWSG